VEVAMTEGVCKGTTTKALAVISIKSADTDFRFDN
jgi:hypothetical protein